MTKRELFTELDDRTLRFDGVSIVDPALIPQALARGVPIAALRATELTPDVELYNSLTDAEDQLKVLGKEPIPISMDWQLPAEYKNLDLEEYVFDKFTKNVPKDYTAEQIELGAARVLAELEQIKSRGMSDFLRTIIYILDVFREKDILWGVGRGSSCASYILFLLGLHVVDCVKFDVSMDEFFHD